MAKTPETSQSQLHDLCGDLMEHTKLLRDYGTTPGNVWLARSELNKIDQLTGEIEQLLEEIKAES
ncbi:MAG TPA: hypothetical protein VNA68_00015 [Candidatus Dormibacteraeota bacterium]|nr:hypothetical protein [Candidatus Dormibacteraeota bacterium]